MTAKFKKLKALLEELFQINQPDLDFGLYRIMNAKRAEISGFLENDLFPQVREAFAIYRFGDIEALELELAQVEEGARLAGFNSEDSPRVMELRARIKNIAPNVKSMEGAVYDHLYSFFRRYYSDGDFLAKRVYKSGVYAIPYEGEEVAFHWANKDQYYIKSNEYLRDYTFRLNPDDPDNPMRVHFCLSDAAECEHNNNKAPNEKDRVFVLTHAENPINISSSRRKANHGEELIICFEYRPSTIDDWPEHERSGKKKPPTQKDLNDLATKIILQVNNAELASWITELGKPHKMVNGELAEYNVLGAHLRRYTSRNTFDFFIHKDLQAFLNRELDFYIKNEVMHLEDVQNESIQRVEQYLSTIKVIRTIAGKIIDFLAQLENFQKKLWLKKKFVVETNYCITVGCIPEEFYPEIIVNESQCQEWINLHAIDQINGDLVTPGYTKKISIEFLSTYPTLMVDTRHFERDFTYRLLEAIGDIEDQTDGTLFHSENFQALSLMKSKFREKVKCVYIDPPYNTDASSILYKNNYKDSSWLSMMMNRLFLSRALMTTDGVLCCAIDDEEVSRVRMVMQDLFQKELGTVVVRSNPAGRKSRGQLSPSHEFALFFGNEDASPGSLPKTEQELARYPFEDDTGRYAWNNLIRHGSGDRREDVPTMFFPIYVSKDDQIRVPELCWVADERRYEVLEEPRDDEIVIWPIRRNNGKIIEKRWHRGLENIRNDRSQYRIRRKGDIVDIDFKIRMDTGATPRTWWGDSRFASSNRGAKIIKNLFGNKAFDYPKAVGLVEDCLRVCGLENSLMVIDYFAGSGTTGHAVIDLNRIDGNLRKFVLVEMSNYFDTVLLPRLKKVTFTPEWETGIPKRYATPEEVTRSPRIFKILRLESYEDTLNNLEINRTEIQEQHLYTFSEQGADSFREQYILRYMLDVETRGSQSLLNVQAFTDPHAYKLKVKLPGSDESREINVDLLETFNWLIGLKVRHIASPQTFSAVFERDTEKRLRLSERLKQETDGPHWFRTVKGATPDGRRVLIIWRKLVGDPEKDNLVLEEWFTEHYSSSANDEFDIIWVNGGCNLENIKGPSDIWNVRLIEDDFHHLMFNTEGS